jgi:TPR repeat protein
MRILIFLVFIIPHLSFGQNCKDKSWVSGPVIIEENEWFFFKGEAADMDVENATLKARGMALDRLVTNCESIPHQTKIFRICKEKIGAGFQVYTQSAVYKGDCFQIKMAKPEDRAKLINKPLNEEFNFYNENVLKKLAPVEYECNPSVTKLCLEKGTYFFDLGMYSKALEFLEYSCEAGNFKACFLGGFASFLIKEQNASLSLFRKTCNGGDSNACLFLGFDYELINNSRLAKSNYQKSCYLDNSRGCLLLGELYAKLNNVSGSLKTYHESCLMNSGEGCEMMFKKLSAFPDVAEIFGHKACILKRGGTCFGLGLKKLENKKYQEALKFFKRSCDLEEAMGCRQTGELVRSKSMAKSLRFFDDGCDLGDLPSCLTLAGIFKSDPMKLGYYSMMSCVLGDINSCFLWGKYLAETKDIPVAKRVLNTACEKGQSNACELGRKI